MTFHVEHVCTAEISLGVRPPILDMAGYWLVTDNYQDAYGPFETHGEADSLRELAEVL